jgi:thioester reductase-like protein
VKGDMSLPDLGLSREQRNISLKKVNIMFQAGATVTLNVPFHVVINVNTKGTAHVIVT